MSNLPASLLDELDKKLLVLLRDGRTLIGYLRSIDQFSNLLLHQTVERIYVNDKYGDIPRGIFLIRGENVALCGEIDDKKEAESQLKQIPIEEILDLQQEEIEQKQRMDQIRTKVFKEKGLYINSESIQDTDL